MLNETQSRFRPAQSLKQLTTLRMGGVPLFYRRPGSYDELADLLRSCKDKKIRYRILGGGSNLVVEDCELDFGVIHIVDPAFNWIRPTDGDVVQAGAGVSLRKILRFCRECGCGGAEFLAGIPGTLGGAIAGNAGARGQSIDSVIRQVVAVDEEGRRHEIKREDMDFSYRSANIGTMVITEAALNLPPRSPELVGQLIRKNISRKKNSQPTDQPNAGCIFKNPGNESAGRLLDLCGFKGWGRGGARVSDAHANFICNDRQARSDDVFGLIEDMKNAVADAFGIELELEVKLWRKSGDVLVA